MSPPRLRFSAWLRLVTDHAPLIDAAAATDPTDVAAVARLRRDHDAELVRAALDLATARRKAQGKFPGRWRTLIADAEGVEQASSAAAAAHKAARFAETLGRGAAVLDFCSGIGGDATALREAGLRVLAVDRDPVRAWMTRRNAGCPAACADVGRLDIRGGACAALHIDPARRNARGRVFRLADYAPGPDVLGGLLADCPNAAIKLAPGVDADELAAAGLAGELEFVSESGRLVQALLWTGGLARHERAATLVQPDAAAETIAGRPGDPPLGPLGRCLFTVDPAAERARLMHLLCDRLGIHAPHPRLGLLTADRAIDSPWLTPFRLIEQMPWRLNKVKAWLDAHDAGVVEVKTRGKAVDPDRVQLQLRGRGSTPYAVFVLRWDERMVALITERLGGGGA